MAASHMWFPIPTAEALRILRTQSCMPGLFAHENGAWTKQSPPRPGCATPPSSVDDHRQNDVIVASRDDHGQKDVVVASCDEQRRHCVVS